VACDLHDIKLIKGGEDIWPLYTATNIVESWLMDRLVTTLCATGMYSESRKIISALSRQQDYAQFAERFFTSAVVLKHFYICSDSFSATYLPTPLQLKYFISKKRVIVWCSAGYQAIPSSQAKTTPTLLKKEQLQTVSSFITKLM
jgi:hypothetical protein